MKKIITFYLLLTFSVSNSQCPTPSNLSLSIPFVTAAQLSWTENGTATVWEIVVEPNFNIGSPLPTISQYVTVDNPNIISGLPPINGCYVFFVRAICSLNNYSDWSFIGTFECSTDVYAYLNSLNNREFSKENVKAFPNPYQESFKIAFPTISNEEVVVKIYDMLGKLVEEKTVSNTTIFNQTFGENLSIGIYNVVVKQGNEVQTLRIVKN